MGKRANGLIGKRVFMELSEAPVTRTKFTIGEQSNHPGKHRQNRAWVQRDRWQHIH
jgi:hypothetical protein